MASFYKVSGGDPEAFRGSLPDSKHFCDREQVRSQADLFSTLVLLFTVCAQLWELHCPPLKRGLLKSMPRKQDNQ